LQTRFCGRPISLVLGILQDKDWRHMCEALAPLARRILVVPVKSERTAAPMELVEACAVFNPGAEIHAVATLRQAFEATQADPFVVVTGSLYLVGEALELLRVAGSDAADEHNLNEWNAITGAVAEDRRR
jgi:dihydrofolate synthase/folylpolyglutamate synthase